VSASGPGGGLRAAIVGSGGIAPLHALSIEQLGGRVVAVCGRTLAGARALGRGTAWDDLGALLRAERPDVVHVCSPNHLHAEHSLLALAAGAHVFCEKPLATTRAAALELVEAAARAGRIGAVSYCYRGYPVIQELRHAVAQGRYGRLRRVAGEYLSADLYDPAKYVWHFTPELRNPSFVVLDYGVHWFDLLEHVTGQRIAELQAQLSTHERRRVWRGGPGQGPRPAGGRALPDGGVEVAVELEEQADLLFRLSEGAAGSATFSALSPGNPNHIVLSADGSAGGFDWCQETADLHVDRSRGDKATRHRDPARLPAELAGFAAAPAGHPEGYRDAFRNVVASAWRAMRGEPVAYPSFADGCRGVALVEAVLESGRTRRPVEPIDIPSG
jgi:predicted dehydrogenase